MTDGARFCPACGAAAPGAGPGPAVAERRVTSVLFADLVGFTTVSEDRDPEDVRELLSGYFEVSANVVARYGGTIEKFIGDAVMAVWGVPRTHEDDAERAVRAGLDLVDAVARFGQDHHLPGLALRVGVVTGEVAVTVGAVGQGMVAGDAVNTAARIQAAADPGRVWVDGQTMALSVGAITYTDVGRHVLRGRSGPVDLFAADAHAVGAVGRRRPDRVQAPMTGRDRVLRSLCDGFDATVADGRGRLLVVSGEAGVGKSRLGLELHRYLDGLPVPVRWHWSRCLSYGDGVAYSALSAMVRARIGVSVSDDPTAVGAALDAAVAHFVPADGDRTWLRTRLGVLLGLDDGRYAREDLFAAWLLWLERLSEGVNPVVWVVDDAHHADDGLLDLVEHVATAARAPVMIVLLTRPELLARRDRLTGHARATVVEVAPLDDGDMAALVGGLVGDLPRPVLADLVARAAGVPLYAVETVRSLLDRGLLVEGGATRTLAPGVDTAALRSVRVPASLRLLVASRLDNLGGTERDLVGHASVLGLTFAASALAEVSGLDRSAVEASVDRLVALDVVARVEEGPGAGLAFVHPIVREIAYEMQSRRTRAHRHEVVAELLASGPDATAEVAGVIARHLLDALDLQRDDEPGRAAMRRRAALWSQRAALRSASVAAYADALRHYLHAIELETDPAAFVPLRVAAARAAHDAARFEEALDLAREAQAAATDPDDGIRAAAVAGLALRGLGRSGEAVTVLAPCAEVAGGDTVAASTVALALARALSDLGRIDEARPAAEAALRLAEDSDDPRTIAAALNGMAIHLLYRDLPRLGQIVLVELAALARRHHLLGPLALALSNQTALSINRDPRAAITAGREGVAVARQSGRPEYVVGVADNLVIALTVTGAWDEVTELHEETAETYEAISIVAVIMAVQRAVVAEARGADPEPILAPVLLDGANYGGAVTAKWADFARGLLARRRGDHATAARLAGRGVHLVVEREGLSDDFSTLWTLAVEWSVDAGDLDAARTLVALVDGAPGGRAPRLARAELPRLRALVAIAAGDPTTGAAIEADLRAAITGLGDFGAVPHRARAEAALAGRLARHGPHPEADVLAASARATFDRLGARAWLAAPGAPGPSAGHTSAGDTSAGDTSAGDTSAQDRPAAGDTSAQDRPAAGVAANAHDPCDADDGRRGHGTPALKLATGAVDTDRIGTGRSEQREAGNLS
jgi:class 3 adenylate cyclase/tetratricopeptide (TPR) repeat protein